MSQDDQRRLLEGIGLEVNILFGPSSAGLVEWRDIPAVFIDAPLDLRGL